MTLKNLLCGVAATAMVLSSCSNDDILDPNANGTSTTTDGGFLAVNIQLPTTAATGRASNDNFDDGTANEYAVYNAALVIFKGADEANATVVGAYDLTDLGSDNGSSATSNLTATYLMAAKINGITLGGGEKLYALALVNYNTSVFSVSADNRLMFGGTEFSGTFTQLQASTSNSAFCSGESEKASRFFMTNAPMSKKIGGATGTAADLTVDNVETLTPFDINKIKPTQAEAKEDPAANIYVERAVAKVTLKWESNGKLSDTSYNVELLGWTVNNTENNSYIIRNLGIGGSVADYLAYTSANLANNNYRFVGHSDMGTTALHPNIPAGENACRYRTYWCVDPSYSTPLAGTTAIQEADWKSDKNYIFYPHENTFDTEHQTYRNTSRVAMKVKIAVPGDRDAADEFGQNVFYVLNGDQKTLYTKTSDVQAYFINRIARSSEFIDAMHAALNAGKSYTYTAGDVVITCARNAKGIYELTGISYGENITNNVGTDKTFSAAPSADYAENLIKSLNSKYVFEQYKDGICYYDLRIMHFASTTANYDLAPWTAPENGATTVAEAYGNPADDANYLGRYGMVRNNWYDLTISSVKNIGKPEVPDANTDTPDDNKEVEKYIAFKINILSWAKRTNSYDL